MSKKEGIPSRADAEFVNAIKNIKIKRQNIFPKERLKPKSSSRITLAMSRHPLFLRIKKDIINADLP
jgi:hypothetical protein|tara:strand:- start:616 stop:816 length:201 start_codon:yes stop_codon:yes gene_type:complete